MKNLKNVVAALATFNRRVEFAQHPIGWAPSVQPLVERMEYWGEYEQCLEFLAAAETAIRGGDADTITFCERVNQLIDETPLPSPMWEGVDALPRPPTREAEERGLAEKGLSGPLLHLMVKDGGVRRANARAEFVQAAVKAAVCEEDERRFTIAMGTLESRGVGGHLDCAGEGTARTVFGSKVCGSGRKQARDGEAWNAAIADALTNAKVEWGMTESTEVFVVVDEEDDELFLISIDGPEINYSRFANGCLAKRLLGVRHLRADAIRLAQFAVKCESKELAEWASRSFERCELEAQLGRK